MLIYLDADNKCHITNDGTMIEALAPVQFENKCYAYIEGYRFFPQGETWIREDGSVFGLGVGTPWRDRTLLDEFQAQYEVQQKTINEYEAALTEIETALGVTSE